MRNTNAALSFCGVDVDKKSKISCNDQWSQFLTWSEQVEKDYFSYDSTLDPPKKTDGTPLRNFYNQLQSLCNLKALPPGDVAFLPNRDEAYELRNQKKERTIRLIFWWNVQANFRRAHQKDLDALARWLKERKIDVALPALDGRTGWQEYRRFFDDLQEKLYTTTDSPPENVARALQALQGLSVLEPAALPLSWVEPNAV